MIIRAVVAFGIGWGALYTAQHYWLQAVTVQISQTSNTQFMPAAPAFPTIDPDKMVRAINPPITIDTRAAQRAAAESMVRQIDQQNRNALSHVPVAPYIPGMHH